MWPTPAASNPQDGEEPETWLARREEVKAKGINGNGMGMPLEIASKLWPTPSAAGAAHPGRTTNSGGQAQLDVAANTFPRPAPPTPTDGATTSPERRTLNPLFVEALMGWPEGWSSASIDSGCSATAWSRWWRRMRSALSRLV